MSDCRPDEELAAAARDGALSAFDRLVRRHNAGLVRFLCQYARSQADAQDLAQDAFIRAFRKLHLYDSRRSFRVWLFTIARRVAASDWRRRSRTPLAAASGVPDPELDAAPAPTPQERLMAAERDEQLWQQVRRLPPAQRRAVWLFYVEGMSGCDVAGVLGRSEVGVRVLLYRARAALARQLREDPVPAAACTAPRGGRWSAVGEVEGGGVG